MSGADVTISCPHCQRQYTMKIDPERLMRLKTRATCGRCGNTFDAASRIVPASEATTDPKLPRIDVAPSPAASLVPKASPLPTVPDLRDEMEELAREFAEAAARFTPIAAKRPAAVLTAPPTTMATPEPTSPTSEPTASAAVEPAAPTAPATSSPSLSPSSPSPPSVVAAVEEPTKHVAVADSAVADAPADLAPPAKIASPAEVASPPALAPPPDVAPSASDVAAAYDELSLEAAPEDDDELAASPPTQSRAPAQLGWLELADRGLSALEPPPSPGAAALEALLSESETLALPPTPAAS